nr:hypothetical protein [Candidatus Sigynarchaeota archaeon]
MIEYKESEIVIKRYDDPAFICAFGYYFLVFKSGIRCFKNQNVMSRIL